VGVADEHVCNPGRPFDLPRAFDPAAAHPCLHPIHLGFPTALTSALTRAGRFKPPPKVPHPR